MEMGKTFQNWEEFEQFRDEWCRKTGLVFRVGKQSKNFNQQTEIAEYDNDTSLREWQRKIIIGETLISPAPQKRGASD